MGRVADALSPELRRLGAYLFLVGAVAFSFWVDHQQDIDRCRARNESTAESARIITEAMVAAATDAEPERVRAFLDDIDRRLREARVDCT